MSLANTSPVRVAAIAHIVLFVKDPEASARWYSEILNMEITARAADGPYKGGIFMSFGQHDHDIALFQSQAPDHKGREFEHVGLRLATDNAEDLRRIYAFFLDKGVKIAEVLDHGVSTGIYFYDPDGHMLEVFHQRIPAEGGAAIAELRGNEGQADPVTLDPLRG
ncbi:catechol-2,3-dioxygenase [Novosphingobium fluoreni]|uniref:Catechol-2,3-dioxygenase n=1 Tax=Novosphingobium fluoreni TaxID=1391222 RepID=A0A7W6BV77_9SPHN|nr:VOC family protein [Novosphingobium fluoreni]MBB3938616.1 catechol-2,3-dioxygenase [Novosphingobium fluoreni]